MKTTTSIIIACLLTLDTLHAQDGAEPIDLRAFLEKEWGGGVSIGDLANRIGQVSDYDFVAVLSDAFPQRSVVIGFKSFTADEQHRKDANGELSYEVFVPYDPSRNYQEHHIRFIRKTPRNEHQKIIKIAWELIQNEKRGIQEENRKGLSKNVDEDARCYFFVQSSQFEPKTSYVAGGMIVDPYPKTKSHEFFELLLGIVRDHQKAVDDSKRIYPGNYNDPRLEVELPQKGKGDKANLPNKKS